MLEYKFHSILFREPLTDIEILVNNITDLEKSVSNNLTTLKKTQNELSNLNKKLDELEAQNRKSQSDYKVEITKLDRDTAEVERQIQNIKGSIEKLKIARNNGMHHSYLYNIKWCTKWM